MAARMIRFAARNTLCGITKSTKQARFPGRGIITTATADRLATELTVKRCSRVITSLCAQSNSQNTLVQVASRQFSQFPPSSNIVLSSKMTDLGTEGSSDSSLEESASEGEEEATNGRKRIKPHELLKDDP